MKKNLKDVYFNSIDELPVWNWWKIQETGDLIYLRKDGRLEAKRGTVKMWTEIHDEYLEEYGMTDEFKRNLRLKRDWILKQSKYLVEGDRFASTQADIVQAKMNEGVGGDTMKKEDILFRW